jgi:hypothetical protein
MELNEDNYFSLEASNKYLSVSQYKSFNGTYGQLGCEARAMAELRGEWRMEMSTALLVGSYVDAHFMGTLNTFKAQHPEILTKNGELRADYNQANDIIARIERDPYFVKCMAGEKQVIMSAEVFGVPWKIKIDSLHRGVAIVDLKVMKAIRDAFWVPDLGRLSLIEYWGYNIQAAIYQKVYEINTGEKIPFLVAIASKEKVTDIEVVGFTQQDLDQTLSLVFPNINRINDLKNGRVEPTPCGLCDFCRTQKVLTGPVHFSTLTAKLR